MNLQRSTLFRIKCLQRDELNVFLTEILSKISKNLNLKTFRNIGIVTVEVGFLILMLASYNLLTSPDIQTTENVALLYENSYPIILTPTMGLLTMIFGLLIFVLVSDEIVSGYFE
jgi:hypothetical protein